MWWTAKRDVIVYFFLSVLFVLLHFHLIIMEEKVLASCSGVVKIFKGNISQTPREHSSTISLVRVSSNFYLQQDGNGVKKTRLKVLSGASSSHRM